MDNPVFFIDRDGMFADTLDGDGEPKRNPFQSSPPTGDERPKKSVEKFVPSDKTLSLFEEGEKLLSDVFDYEVGAEAGYSVGVKAKIGATEVEGEATVGNISLGSTKDNIFEAKIEGPGVKGGIVAGPFQAEGVVTTGSAKVSVDKNLKVKPSTEGATATGSIVGNVNLSLSNAFTLGASVKLPSPQGVSAKVGGSVNLYNAAKGAVTMLSAAGSYLSDVASSLMSW